MIRLKLSLDLDYEILDPAADFIFNIHAAHTQQQRVVDESLGLSQNIHGIVDTDPTSGNRYLRLRAGPAPLRVSYSRDHRPAAPHRRPGDDLPRCRCARLPARCSATIYPSRYCQSDRLLKLAMREFGHLRRAMRGCRRSATGCCSTTAFTSNTSDTNTSAVDTLIDQVGRLPRLRPPDDRAVPRHQHPGALRDRHRLRRRPGARPDRLPRLCRGLPRRPLVHVRPVGHRDPDGLRALRHRPRCRRRRLRDDLRRGQLIGAADQHRRRAECRRPADHAPAFRTRRCRPTPEQWRCLQRMPKIASRMRKLPIGAQPSCLASMPMDKPMQFDHLRDWIGRSEQRSDEITAMPIAALSATLDRDDPPPLPGSDLPPLWHWMYFNPIAKASETRRRRPSEARRLPAAGRTAAPHVGRRPARIQPSAARRRRSDAHVARSPMSRSSRGAAARWSSSRCATRSPMRAASRSARNTISSTAMRPLPDAPVPPPQPAPDDAAFSREIGWPTR